MKIEMALENYLEELGDLKEAAKRLKDKADKIITSKKLHKSLGL